MAEGQRAGVEGKRRLARIREALKLDKEVAGGLGAGRNARGNRSRVTTKGRCREKTMEHLFHETNGINSQLNTTENFSEVTLLRALSSIKSS